MNGVDARWLGVPLWMAVAGLCLGLWGCAGPAVEVGRTGVAASSSLGTVQATLGPEVRVLTIAAAAERAVRARGLTVVRRNASEDSAVIEAEQRRGAGGYERVLVWVSTQAAGPGLAVRVEPFGDEPRARVVMEGILVELGYGRAETVSGTAP